MLITTFDYLRALCSLLIVSLRSGLLGLIGEWFTSSTANILEITIGYIAVPIFIQISLFLLFVKVDTNGWSYLIKKRIPKLVALYLFWVSLHTIFKIVAQNNLSYLQATITSFKTLIEFLVSGGFSPYYFFFILVFLTILSQSFDYIVGYLHKPEKKIYYYSFLGSCLVVFLISLTNTRLCCVYEEYGLAIIGAISNIAKWDYNPINFIPYIFSTAIVAYDYKNKKIKSLDRKLIHRLIIVFLLSAFFFTVELSINYNMLSYSRLSLIFFSWGVLYLAVAARFKSSKLVQFISSYSLGIYVFHIYFTDYSEWIQYFVLITGHELPFNVIVILKFIIAVLGSILLTMLFRQVSFLKNYV